jgi:hypothetical protein
VAELPIQRLLRGLEHTLFARLALGFERLERLRRFVVVEGDPVCFVLDSFSGTSIRLSSSTPSIVSSTSLPGRGPNVAANNNSIPCVIFSTSL